MHKAITRNGSGPLEFTGAEDIAPLGGPEKHELNDYSLQRSFRVLILLSIYSRGISQHGADLVEHRSAGSCSSDTKESNPRKPPVDYKKFSHQTHFVAQNSLATHVIKFRRRTGRPYAPATQPFPILRFSRARLLFELSP